MEKFILDTNILLGYLRKSGYAEYIEKKYKIFRSPNLPFICIVSVGEMYSLAMQRNWGQPKLQDLKELLKQIPWVDINHSKTLERYAEIDAFSQGKHPSQKLPVQMTSRNMGKNDLWIASVGSVLNATLLTTDSDFDHLNPDFLKVTYIDSRLTGDDANGS